MNTDLNFVEELRRAKELDNKQEQDQTCMAALQAHIKTPLKMKGSQSIAISIQFRCFRVPDLCHPESAKAHEMVQRETNKN